MKGLTNTTLWEFLVFLQEKAKYNVLEVKQNLDKIKDYNTNLLNNNIESKDLIHRLMRKNEEIRKENSMLLMLHSFILQINEQESWYDSEEASPAEVTVNKQENKELSKTEYVQMILDGEIDILGDDECLEDEDILNTVYKEFLKSEQYEACETIKNRKKRKSQNSSLFSQGNFSRILEFRFLKNLKNKFK